MKKLLMFLFAILFASFGFSQVTKTIGTEYATIAAAVTDLNTNGVPAGGVTINVPAGYTETAPSGGFSLTATGTLADPIIFQKSGIGNNPLITAYTGGTGTPGSAVQDGIWRLVGSDYVTIDGIDLTDPNAANPATMEYGYGLFKASVTNGCQYNTIKNCVVTLNRLNFATGTAPAVDGSRAINVMNSLSTTQTTAVTPTTAAGTNSYNMFYSNTLQNCHIGIAIIGFAGTTPFTLCDFGNDIGGTSLATGNNIINFGGGAVATNPAAGVRTLAQYGINVSYNTINNNNGSGVNHVTTLRGIFLNTATSANATISYNNITVKGGGTTTQVSCIENVSGSTAASNTININNNTITATYSTATTGVLYILYNSSTAATVNINTNTIVSASMSGTGTFYGVETGTPTTANVNNNVFNLISRTGIGTIYAIKTTSPTNLTVTGNTIDGVSQNAALSTGSSYGFYSSSSAVNVNVSSNIFRNFSSTGASSLYGTYEFGSLGLKTYQSNQIYNFSTVGGTIYGIREATGTTNDYSNNQVYNLTCTGGTAGAIYGIYPSSGTTNNIYKNKIYNLSLASTGPTLYGMYLAGGTTNNVYNNFISDLRTPAANSGIPLVGIYISSGTTNNVYYNTIYLNATSSGALFGSSALYASTTPTLNLINNILVNTSTPNGAAYVSCYRRSFTTLTSYGASSNNNLFYAGLPTTNKLIMYDGTNSYSTLAAFKTAVGPVRDAASISENPNWISTTGSDATFLHINNAIYTGIESGGTIIATFDTDFDGDYRFGNVSYPAQTNGGGTAPDLGADEFDGIPLPLCAGVTPSTVIGASALCAGNGTTLSLSNNYTDLGISYEWSYATTAGGPYTVIGSNPTQATGNLSATTYYICTITCAYAEASETTPEYTLTVNPIPEVSVTPSSGSYCGTGSVSLTASGADTYSWSPATGLDVTTGASVNANPASTTTYTVSGTALGCVGTTNVQISVNAIPSAVAVTPTSASMCDGTIQQLTATGGLIGGTGTIGIGAVTNTGSTPYRGYYGGSKTQHLYLASELTAMGLTSGAPISAISFSISTFASPYTFNGFTIGMKNTASTVLTTTLETGITTVLSPSNYVLSGTAPFTVSHTLTTPFNWDGTSNLLIETCFNNNNGGGTSSNSATIVSSTTATNLSVYYSADNTATVCSAPGVATTTTTRPNISFVYSVPTTMTWTPITDLYTDAAATLAYTGTAALSVYAKPMSGITYTATATSAALCTSSNTSVITMVSGASISTQPVSTTKCAGQTATFTVSSTVPGVTYVWRKNGTAIDAVANPSAATATLSLANVTALDADNYDVVLSAACGAPVTSDVVTLTVNALPTVVVNNPTASYCLPGGNVASITASGADSYTWSPASGLDVTTGAIVNASPATTTTYTVIGTGSNGCTNTATSIITVGPYPTNVTATASNNDVCSGSLFDLFSSTDNNIINTYINSSDDGGFENGSNFALNNWIVLNGTYNNWFVGNTVGASVHAGTNAAYVGTDFVGTANSSVNHFYRDVVIPAGASNISLKFYLKMPVIDAGYDYLKVYTTTSANTPVVGTTPSTGYTERFTYDTPALSTFTEKTVSLPDALAGTTVRLVFTYKCDAVANFGVPAVDNISLTASIATSNTFAWASSPAGFTSALQNPTGLTQSSSTTYTVTATNNYNCSATASRTVNNVTGSAISTQPIATTKCTGQTASFNVVATGPNVVYQWYKGVDAINVLVNASANTSNLVITNVSALDAANYHVVVSADCGTPVTSDAVSLTVNITPTATVSSNSPVCTGSSLNLTGTTDIGISYAWTGPNGFTSTAQNPTISSVTTSAAGIYSFTATLNGCSSVSGTTTVTVNETPSVISITPNSASIAQGSIQSLIVSGGTIGNVATLGNGSSFNAIDVHPTPYGTYYKNHRVQYMILASELQSLGAVAGSNLNSIGFNVNSLNGSSAMPNYAIKLKTTSASTLTTTFETGTYTTVWENASFMPVLGWNTHTFTSPFVWDGTSNLIVDICYDLVATYTENASVYFTTTATNLASSFRSDSQVACGTTSSATVSTARANMQIGFSSSTTITWSPITNLYTDAFATIPYTLGANASTVYAKPTANRIYTATATSAVGCTSSGNATITIGVNRTWSSAATSDDWTNPLNWTNGVPANIDNVIIPATATNFPTITLPATINNLTIESNASGTGSLLDNGNLTINGTATVKQYVDADKWHFISSPVSSAITNVFSPALNANIPIYIRNWNQATQLWEDVVNLTTNLTVGKGFAIWATASSPTIVYNGSLNNTSSISYGTGWNFIANPFVSALDWNALSLTGKPLSGYYYYWNSATASFTSTNGTLSLNLPATASANIIPSMQGFFMYSDNAGALGGLNGVGARVHNNHPLYKNTNTLNDIIRITAQRGIYKDEALFVYNSLALNSFNETFDARKLSANNNNIPELYTVSNSKEVAIKNFGNYPASYPLNIRMGVAGNVTITASEFANFDANVNITLEDMLTGTIQNLRQNPTYTFAATIGENANRFVLHFATPNGINEPNAGSISIYANNNNIYVNTTELVKEIRVYNMLGQVITTISGNAKSLNTISMNNATGNYVVKVTTDKGVHTEKVFVK